MESINTVINTVTVVGANGTMGRNIAAIFASFGNATVYLVSRTYKKSVEAKNRAYLSVRAESVKGKMIPADYAQLEVCISQSDLVFEACAEDWNIKKEVHKKISNALDGIQDAEKKAICIGTSGLSITKLSEFYSENNRKNVMGMHMFNPPYQMTLCEMTKTKYIDENPELYNSIVEYTKQILHRTVVETADCSAFLGNRIGFQFINETIKLAKRYQDNGGIDYIDAIIGPFTGRLMAPLVTANFVGLDVHKAIIDNLYENTNDYSHDSFSSEEYLDRLIYNGKIGRKVGEGLYKTIVHDSGVKIHQVYDIEHDYYREKMNYVFSFSEEMISNLKIGEYSAAMKALVENHSLEATLCCELLLKYIVYSLNTAKELGCQMKAADDVMATGFHWCPPLAMYEAFSQVCDVKVLCIQRLPAHILQIVDNNHLFEEIENSTYDYRKFFIAKR